MLLIIAETKIGMLAFGLSGGSQQLPTYDTLARYLGIEYYASSSVVTKEPFMRNP